MRSNRITPALWPLVWRPWIAAGLCAALAARCTLFSTQFERIDAGKVRLLDMIYEPPEAAPGDTVLAMAVFSGEPVARQDVFWNVSYKIIYNALGADTALEIHRLEDDGAIAVDTQFSPSTYTVAFRFKVPQRIMHESPMIPQNWASVVPPEYRSMLPPELASLQKSDVLAAMDLIALIGPDSAAAVVRRLAPGDSLLGAVSDALANDTLLNALSQMTTVWLRFFGDVRSGELRFRSTYTVRYHRALARFPGVRIRVNRNPHIAGVGIYKVKGDGLLSFDPAVHSQPYELISLFGPGNAPETPPVVLDKGYSYFVASFADSADSVSPLAMALYPDSVGVAGVENFRYRWFFQLDSDETDGVSPSRWPGFSGFGSFGAKSEPFTPPRDQRIRSMTLWSQVYDQFLGEALRPSASALKEVRCRFEYTKAYLDAAKK